MSHGDAQHVILLQIVFGTAMSAYEICCDVGHCAKSKPSFNEMTEGRGNAVITATSRAWSFI